MDQTENKIINSSLQTGSIDITYFTDPLCCWSWAFEPEWRRLRFEFDGLVTWQYRMSGLLPGWEQFLDPLNMVNKPAQMGPVWMHASHLSGMDMQYNIWMKDPPASSYPACIAVKCAQLQSPVFGEQYLRLLRETIMLKGINIAKHEVLVKTAEEIANQSALFDVDYFKQCLFGKEGLEAFKVDMQQVKNYNINRFPTLILRSSGQQPVLITGYRPYNMLIEAIHKLLPGISTTQKAASAVQYQSYWPSITQRETEEALK